ncbi:MAG TPA: glycoside hydrolase family 71/99-like protein [Pirellulales bacterium]|nr:glycoside hydrolase family 71/99-like protein [Pirellulales bacterium]
MPPSRRVALSALALPLAWLLCVSPARCADADDVDVTTLKNKVLCGYQGWFRCPGDDTGEGWVHWSRNGKRLAPDTLTFEMWPDMAEYTPAERYPAPGFNYPDGRAAELFSSANAQTVLRHFQWQRQYGIDGVWLQHFVVDLPGGPIQQRYPSRRRVLEHVIDAARQTGRAWALSYDMAGMPAERIYDVLTADWKKMVDERITAGPRYLHEGGRPVVQVWGFYRSSAGNSVTPEVAHKLIDFFKAPGPYSAYLLGGGDWDWRRDPQWQEIVFRFDAYAPWNVGNQRRDAQGDVHASTGWWAADKQACEQRGVRWLPVVYPGFSWDNLKQKPPGTTTIARRGGRFLWEQFHELSALHVDGVYVAMFDEVDEGTAIFKVSSQPPTQAHFVGYDGLPSDWYLRLIGEAADRLKENRPIPPEIPIKP